RVPGLAFTLNYKLRAVSALYIYDVASEEVFKRDVLCNSALQSINIQYYNSGFRLSNTYEEYGVKILFAGHPICEEAHIIIYQNLQRGHPDIVFYYKPHPTAGPSESIREYGWLVIDDERHFPVVSLVVSYPSTLVDEYISNDISTVTHAI